MKKILLPALVAGILALAGTPAAAVDGIGLEAGSGDGTDMARVTLRWDMKQRWFQSGDWHLGSYWNVGFGVWQTDGAPGQNEEVTEIGVTPMLRFQQNSRRGLYVDAGLGVHLLSSSRIGDKRLGTLVQFGSGAGIGWRFGDKGQYDLSYHYQHLSNGSIKQPNNGINFNQIRFHYRF